MRKTFLVMRNELISTFKSPSYLIMALGIPILAVLVLSCLFFEGTFVGKSYLDLSYTKDTLPISLGRDKGIIVKREKIFVISTGVPM